MDFAELFCRERKAVLTGKYQEEQNKAVKEAVADGLEQRLKGCTQQATIEHLEQLLNAVPRTVTREEFRGITESPNSAIGKEFQPVIVGPTETDEEPFVGYTPENLVALCFSGGGVRSSTFNLGVLQGLAEVGLLQEFDYLSTVSGGGYVGSWWTAWRHRNKHCDERFPKSEAGQPEPRDVSWLRQRGDFLSPTMGLFQGEIWTGAFLYLSGLLVTLVASLSLLAAAAAVYLIVPKSGLPFFTVPAAVFLLAISLAFAASLGRGKIGGKLQRAATCLAGWALLTGLIGVASWAALHFASLWTVASSSVVTATAGTILFKLTGWFSRRDVNEKPSAITVALASWLPRLLAMAGVASLAFVAAALSLVVIYAAGGTAWGAAAAAFVFFTLTIAASWLAGRLPTLRQFYRSRIDETFLSAALLDGTQSSSDVAMAEFADAGTTVDRPIHLINCCSNEPSGVALQRRGRGGRSATISPLAYTVANASQPAHEVTLGTAVTASAAAANPFMGQYSARLGPAVSFMMATLNLRLGLWLLDPRTTPVRQETGWQRFTGHMKSSGRFLSELLGQPDFDGMVHFSDGGHFENLGLYEMIRRQCRYILVSDCGADPDITFAEFASLQRLVRQDFGVDIEIDLNALRAGPNGRSSQHMVAGKIRYPGTGKNNNGILIYVKPTLTGDESEDVTQYCQTNKSFPHESTADQFYDSAQWESYRQLGYHAILTGFEFREGYEPADVSRAPRMFEAASREWKPPVKRLSTRSAKRIDFQPTGRREGESSQFLAQLFPELDEQSAAATELTQVLAVVDSLECEFENRNLARHSDHLDNWGWINWADRVTTTDAVRRWWPFISPLYGIHFRNEFFDVAFGLNPTQAYYSDITKPGCVRVFNGKDAIGNASGPAADRWRETFGTGRDEPNDRSRLLSFEIPSPLAESKTAVQLGTLFFTTIEGERSGDMRDETTSVIRFYEGDIQVAPGFWSVGIQAKLLNALLWKTATNEIQVDGSRIVIQALPDACHPHGEAKPPKPIVRRPTLLHWFLKRGFIRRIDGILELRCTTLALRDLAGATHDKRGASTASELPNSITVVP